MTDLKIVADNARMWKESTNNLNRGMNGLLGIGIDDTMTKVTAGLQLFAGLASMVGVAKSLIGVKQAITTARAAAETGANLAIPGIGWGKIAVALGAAVVAGAAVYAVCKQFDVKGDLSNPAERNMIAQTVGAVS